MDRSCDLKLVSITYTDGLYGKKIATEVKRQVFCNKASCGEKEFYKAYNVGLRAELKLTMFYPDYQGETVCELYDGNSWVKYDIYRTYIKSNEELELWVTKKNTSLPVVVTLFTDNKIVKIHGVYFSSTNGSSDTSTGKISADSITLVLRQDIKAFVGNTNVGYVKPKTYAGKSAQEKVNYFTMDSNSYFVIGDVDPVGNYTYQSINSQYDDVYRVQSVSFVNRNKMDTEYLEVIGK